MNDTKLKYANRLHEEIEAAKNAISAWADVTEVSKNTISVRRPTSSGYWHDAPIDFIDICVLSQKALEHYEGKLSMLEAEFKSI